jgi:cytochrome P450
MRTPFEFFDDCAERFGDTFSLRFFGLPPLAVYSNPEAVKEIFADPDETLLAGKFNLTLRAFLGEHSVLMLDGKEHLRQRRLLLPPFHGERMQAYGQAMLDVTDESIDRWPMHEVFSIHGHMQTITLRVILRTIFGIEESRRLTEMSAAITGVLELAAWPPLLIPSMQVDLGPWSPWGRYLRRAARMDELLRSEIRQRRRGGHDGRNDVLSLLIDARDEQGQPMSEDELVDELVTLLVAGHETTATGLAWALRWILDTPAIEHRLLDELDRAAREGPLTPERIGRLELLDAVVREALRLQPVIPIVGRVLDRAARVGGFDLPAGTGVVCSIYLAQRRPSVYPDPRRFDPDRYLGKKFTPNEFFPFGGGVRRCIGMAFALYEMKMVLARVLTRATLRLDRRDPIRVVRRSITLTPSGGLRVRLESRRDRSGAARAA